MKIFISQFMLVFAIVLALNATIRPSIDASTYPAKKQFDPAVFENASYQPLQEKNRTSKRHPSFIGRERQGVRLHEKHATFQIVGDRIHVTLPKNKQRVMIALENLTLERVHKYIGRVEGQKTWEIEGKVTEYEGQNYILLSRAIVNSLDLE